MRHRRFDCTGGLYWPGLSNDPTSHLERALVWSAAYGRTAVVEFLLAQGVDPAAEDPTGMSALHWAAGNGHLDIVRLMLRNRAPLEARNKEHQTALSTTIGFALQYPESIARSSVVIDVLIAAAADVHAVPFPTGHRALDEISTRHGARPT